MSRKFGDMSWGRATDVETVRRMRFPSASGAPSVFVPGNSDAGPRLLPPRKASPADSAYVRQVYPPWVEKLGGISRDFNVSDFAVVLAAGVGAFATSAALRFKLPSDSVGWLQQMQLYLLSPNAGTSVQFTARINDGPVPGFDNKRSPPGVANLILIDINDLRVRVPMAATVDILFTNLNANGPWTVGGLLAGWYHPVAAELAVWGEASY